MAAGSELWAVAVCATVLFACALAADKEIPSAWGTCHRSDPNFNDCLKNNIRKAVVDLQSGNADLGVKSLDPMKVDKFQLIRGGNGPINVELKFWDAAIDGVHECTVESATTDLTKGLINFELSVPHLTLKSKFSVRGRVLVIPIVGDGVAIVKMQNATIKVEVQGHVADGHFRVDSLDFDLHPQKTGFTFINPAHVPEAQLLSRVVTENDKIIMEELRPPIHVAFSSALKPYAEAVFDNVPFDKIFPQ